MEWLSAAQCLQLGKQHFDAESYILAMRFFALGHIMDRNNEQLLNGFRASASSYTHQLWISNLAQQYPVYHGVQRVVNQNARVFYQPGMSAFMNKEFEVARLYFAEALTWYATNAHLLECFRASVELEYQRTQRDGARGTKSKNEKAKGMKSNLSSFENHKWPTDVDAHSIFKICWKGLVKLQRRKMIQVKY